MRRSIKRRESNIFGMLTQEQISKLRETFNMLDVNSDGFITKQDLYERIESIGNPLSLKEIDELVGDRQINYMTMLTMIGDKLSEIDSEKLILTSFKEFEGSNGKIDENLLRHWLINEGENKLTNEEVDTILKGCVEDGYVDYVKLTGIIKHGEVL